MNNDVLLADIGNTHFHIYDGKKVEHLLYDEAIARYRNKVLYYISVNHHLTKEIEKIALWKNISSTVRLKGEYETMGVDRKALCLSHNNGMFVDAGSAITVDIVQDGSYKGGFVFLGLKAMIKAYGSISPALDVTLNKDISLSALPTTTKEQISYGIIASLKALIDQQCEGRPLYFTGGDGKLLSRFFKDATYDEMLVFNGMQKVIKELEIC